MVIKAGRIKAMRQGRTSLVNVEMFKEEHWSLLAYIDCCCSGYVGRIEHRQMRGNSSKPGHLATGIASGDQRDSQKSEYDDWDFLRDLEAVGFVQLVCYATGLVHIFPAGIKAAGALREHGLRGQSINNFRYL
ncbi:MAG TPA: hypothetical protein VFC63_07225 [Blastocatellia bacterium]|nr:hypothetical protein [Blastocatellia bacterium]